MTGRWVEGTGKIRVEKRTNVDVYHVCEKRGRHSSYLRATISLKDKGLYQVLLCEGNKHKDRKIFRRRWVDVQEDVNAHIAKIDEYLGRDTGFTLPLLEEIDNPKPAGKSGKGPQRGDLVVILVPVEVYVEDDQMKGKYRCPMTLVGQLGVVMKQKSDEEYIVHCGGNDYHSFEADEIGVIDHVGLTETQWMHYYEEEVKEHPFYKLGLEDGKESGHKEHATEIRKSVLTLVKAVSPELAFMLDTPPHRRAFVSPFLLF